MKKHKFTIHTNPDIDAVSACLFGEISNFVKANENAIDGTDPYDISDGKGNFENGKQHSALAYYAKKTGLEVDPKLLAEVEEQETTGKIESPRFSLPEILNAVKSYYRDLGIGIDFDRTIISWAEPIIKGLQLQFEKETEAVEIASRLEHEGKIFTILTENQSFRIALTPYNSTPRLGIVLNEKHGVSASVYADGKNLGIARYPGRECPDLRQLKKNLPGWFIHPAGFLAAWGSRKAPASTPPPDGTPQTQNDLKNLIIKVFSK